MNRPTLQPRPSTSTRGTPWRGTGLLGAAFALVVVACGQAGGAPTPTTTATFRPTPTPIAADVASPQDAAAIVIASDPRFAGTIELTPDLIGASRWWVATPLVGGGYRIEITIGSGDCQAGCIEKHTWTYEVQPNGQFELVSESGDEVPSDLPG